MILAGLRNTWPQLRTFRQVVAVKQQHLVKMVGEHPGCAKTSHAGAEDDCCAGTLFRSHGSSFLKRIVLQASA
jgi:hypothetical protein